MCRIINLWVCCALFSLSLTAATPLFTQPFAQIEDYIKVYKDIAISEMHRTHIPASIKLAQGILESSYGNSYLAIEGNNHFGIKCHSSWMGPSLFRDDDTKNECFRSYPDAYSSYMDHSDFLSRARYEHLYELPKTAYKAWAKGLQQAGYATDQSYSKQLIFIIEKYELHKFDLRSEKPQSRPYTQKKQSKKSTNGNSQYSKPKTKPAPNSRYSRTKTKPTTSSRYSRTKTKPTPRENAVKKSDVFMYNRLKTVVVKEEVRVDKLARQYGISLSKFCKYNDFLSDQILPANTKVFLQNKRSKGPWNIPTHKVKIGETVKDIAQQYGIREAKLYQRNLMTEGTQAAPGQTIYLRKKAPRRPKLISDYYAEEKGKQTREGLSKPVVKPTAKPAPVSVEPVTTNKPKESYIPKELLEGVTFEKENTTTIEIPKKVETPQNNKSYEYDLPKTVTKVGKTVETPAKSVTNKKHTVNKGETLYRLSKLYNVSVEVIKEANKLSDNTISIGQELIIPIR